MKNNTNRISIFDIAKLISIFFVVWGHVVSNIYSETLYFVYLSHMPTFFFISGMFLYKETKQYSSLFLFKKKVRRLLVPYLVWSAISFLFHVLIYLVSGGHEVSEVVDNMLDIFVHARSVWFLIQLFLIEVSTILLVHISNKYHNSSRYHINAYIMYVLLYLFILFFVPGDFLMMEKFRWFYPLFILGYYLSSRIDFEKSKDLFFKWGALSVVAFIVTCIIFDQYKFPLSIMVYPFRLNNIYLAIFIFLGSCLGMMMIFWIATVIDKLLSRWDKIYSIVLKASRYTMDIYVIHMILIYIIIKINIFSAYGKLCNIAISALISLFVTGSIIIFASIMRRFRLYRACVGIDIKKKD